MNEIRKVGNECYLFYGNSSQNNSNAIRLNSNTDVKLHGFFSQIGRAHV